MPARQPSRDETDAWYGVVRNYHRVEAALQARLAALALNVTTHEVLQHLLHTPGLSQQQLAARVFTVKSHLSAIVRDLLARELILRHPDPADARAWQLHLTPAGQALAQQALAAQTALIGAMFAGVPREQTQQFAALLATVEGNLIALDQAPANA
jgi:DNA-binding MarR family transcriptional regulator